MKKCPNCHSDIEENARFCLYCMTPLDEKEKISFKNKKNRKLLIICIIAAVTVLVLTAGCIFAYSRKKASNTVNDNGAVNSAALSDAETTQAPNGEEGNTILDAQGNVIVDLQDNSAVPNAGNSDVGSVSGDSNVAGASTGDNSSSMNNNSNGGSNSSATNAAQPSSGSTQSGSGTKSTTNAPNTTAAAKTSQVKYEYRTAKNGDLHTVMNYNTDKIVITKVSGTSSDGSYTIPSSIDGKTVIAIMGTVFDSSIANSVKKVIIPSSVKCINDFAFSNCYNLTDVYYQGNTVYTSDYAYYKNYSQPVSNNITLHCSSNCSNGEYQYYRKIASGLGLKYSEWNG